MAWHDATCATLDLEWEDGQPGCRKCERKAPKLAPVHPISPPAPPPDTPRSELICTWPPSLFSQGKAGGHEDPDTLAHILANIDEWTGTSSTRPSQRELKSDQRSLQQQPLNPSEPNFLFQGIYSRLPNADSIRLLRLHGSEDTSDPVCGTLENHRLHDPCRPIFEAFSYTWADLQGNSSLCETIFLGPQYDILPVTTNCLAALRRFRTVADRLVWVDAICINQFDLGERAHQVSLMRDIYTSAARVLSYLGDSDHGVESPIVLPQKNNGSRRIPCQRFLINPGPVLRMPYFSRIWVIQEIMLSKTASVTCGNHTVHLEDLLSNSNRLHPRTGAELSGNWLKHLSDMGKRRDIFMSLVATNDCHCGDLRDRVYGLMGLVSREERHKLPIDYNISVQQLYTGLAVYWLASVKGQRQVTPSKVLQIALLPKTTPFLPSWAPDWVPQTCTDVIQGCTPSTTLTFQFDTIHLQKSCGSNWLRNTNVSLRGWSLDKVSWEFVHPDFDSYNWEANKTLRYDALVESTIFPWHQLAADAGWNPRDPARFLPRGGVLALDAVHLFSTSMGQVELTDMHGRLLHGLQLTHLGEFGPEQGSLRQHDYHIHFLPSWEVVVASQKQSVAVYSLRGLSRIVFAPSDRPVPPCSTYMLDIYKSFERFESNIVDHWLVDSFFHGVCAGSAYAHTHIRNDWLKHFPSASNVCQVFNLSFKKLDEGLHLQSVVAAMIEICEDVLAFMDENAVSKGSALRGKINYRTNNGSSVTDHHYLGSMDDAQLAARIREAQATRQPETSSPQEMCAYLRNVVNRHQDSCKNYAPLQTALANLDDELFQPSMFVTIGQEPRYPHPLLLPKKKMGSLRTAHSTESPCPISQAFIIWRARSLLSRLAIDSHFTLEQNFNILWIHVLTMEMVARLRGVLQQRLILKAIEDKMKKVQKIHII